MGRNQWSKRSRASSAHLPAHVHDGGNHADILSGDIGRNCPEGALRDVQDTRATGENQSPGSSAVNPRPDYQENRRACKGKCGQQAAPGAQAEAGRDPIADNASTEAANVIAMNGNMEKAALVLRLKPRTCAI